MSLLNQGKMMFSSHTELVERHLSEISIIFTLLGTGVSFVLGGWDKALLALLILVAFDIVTGCFKGFFVDKDFTSKRLREGFGTKIMYFLVIAIGETLDGVFFSETPILRNLALFFYIYVESVSSLENLGNMGVPLPKKFIEGLGQVGDRVGGVAKMKNGKFIQSDNEDDENVG